MDFVAVDVETANADCRSICQIGIASFRDGALVESWQSLVDPRAPFDRGCIAVHGILPEAVRGAPVFAEVFPQISARFAGRVVASHTPFDRRAIHGAAELVGLQLPACDWLDTARVVRRAWPEYAKKGFGLANLSRRFGIAFQHHDALEDARAAGEILLHAIRASGWPAQQWLQELNRPRAAGAHPANPDGPLFGHEVAFTGTLSRPRRRIGKLAADAGCLVVGGLRETTTLLVVGGGRPAQAAWKSAKLRRAEELVRLGRTLRILGEAEFLQLIAVIPAA